VLVNIKLYV